MKYFSLFSGIGGFELGIQQAYENMDNWRASSSSTLATHGDKSDTHTGNGNGGRTDATCVGYSEIDKYAIQIYERHFNHKNYGDATRIIASELPDFDLLVGGFPCQAFSIAGKRGGLDDARGTLFYDIARIAKEKRPQHLLLENVKGLLSHDNGRTFKLIITTFAELGYDLEWQVLNSKNFGIPQNRERVFIIGHLGRCCGREVFPIGGNYQEDTRKIGEEVSYSLDASYYKGINTGSKGGKSSLEKMKRQMIEITSGVSDAQRIYKSEGIAKTLKGLGGGLGAKTGMYQIEGLRIRRLTPTECERLQGFPDGWTSGVSDTQRYKTLGNAVTTNVVQAIAEKLLFP